VFSVYIKLLFTSVTQTGFVLYNSKGQYYSETDVNMWITNLLSGRWNMLAAVIIVKQGKSRDLNFAVCVARAGRANSRILKG
jgi:hypothetical protein